jgi:glutathione S-transferase
VKLYFRADCPFCWKVRLALHAFDVPYESVETQLGEKHPGVSKLSRSGTVPVAVDDGLIMTDSSVMMEYINEAYAEGALLPGDAKRRTELREIQSFSDKLLGKPLFMIVQQKRTRPPVEWDRQVIAEGTAQWYGNLDYLEQRLAVSSLLSIGVPTLVDCALLPRFALAGIYGVPVDARHPDLFTWFEAWKQQPVFTQTRPTRELLRRD